MTTTADPSVPPMPYVVASWLGYPLSHIVEGLRRGSIAPPAGAPPGWLPPGAEALAQDAATGIEQDDASAGAGATTDGSGADSGASGDSPGAGAGTAADARAAYLALVQAVDGSVDEGRFDALWRSSGDDDATRASHVGGLLWRTIGGDPAPGGDTGALAAAIAERGTRGTLVAWAEAGSDALAERARGDPAALAALAALDAFAFTGVTNGAGPGPARFDPSTGDANLSDAWIDDRAKFVAWRDALRSDPAAAADVATSWRFVDRTLGDAATVTVGNDEGASNQVVFARAGGDAVTGGPTVDRMHGGSGDDALDGGGGDDLVEGAHGDDALSGGEGDDRLDGGAGDDTLAGGRGDDRLAGGSGHDVYAFAAGEGNDVITDADGDGAIVLDGVTLSGDEAGVSFATERDGTGSTTLVVRAAGTAGVPAGEIRVRDWRDGALGIHLAPAADASAAAPAADVLGALSKPRITGATGELKPLVTAGELQSADWREPGNESGPGSIELAVPALPGAARAVARAEDRGRALEAADWARALRAAPAFAPMDAIEAPPAIDVGAVTAADYAGAFAGTAGDHEDGDAAFESVRLPWAIAHETSDGIEPPGVPSRRGG